MSEPNKNTEIQYSEEPFVLSVSIKLHDKNEQSINEVTTEATIPYLLNEENVLIAESRVREQLDIFVNSFKLLFAGKVNKLINNTKNKNTSDESVLLQNESEEHPEIGIDE